MWATRIHLGSKPSNGSGHQNGIPVNGVVHDSRSAVVRLNCGLEWCGTWAAHSTRTPWLARWNT